MKILGFNVPWSRSAPQLPNPLSSGGQPVSEVAPNLSFGTNPPPGIDTSAVQSLSQRYIHSDPRELWYLNLANKLTPSQVLQILRASLGGDLWQSWQLLSLMFDSWSRLRKCSHELRDPVSQAKYKVEAFAEDGEEPTKTASEKASLVRRGFANMSGPNQFTDEENFSGTIYDATDSVFIGMTMQEILYDNVKSPKHGPEILPRATVWIHPRHFTFGNSGVVALFDDYYNRQYSDLSRSIGAVTPDPRKFLCTQFKSRSGSALGAGLMRAIAWEWSGRTFGREWRLKNAQCFGSPYVDVKYKAGTTAEEIAKLKQQAEAGLADHVFIHQDGTTIEAVTAPAQGSQNSQKELMEDADKACAELILGQEGTTKSQPGSLGGKDESKRETKRERIEGLAAQVATRTLQQLARAILLANYGEDSECPVIVPDFTQVEDPKEAALRMQVICGPNMPPMISDDVYSALKMSKPEPGDQVIYNGKVGLLGDTEQPIDPNPKPQPPAPYFDTDDNPSGEGEIQSSSHLRSLLGRASDSDLNELNVLVKAAEQSPSRNGESHAVKSKLLEIASRKL